MCQYANVLMICTLRRGGGTLAHYNLRCEFTDPEWVEFRTEIDGESNGSYE